LLNSLQTQPLKIDAEQSLPLTSPCKHDGAAQTLKLHFGHPFYYAAPPFTESSFSPLKAEFVFSCGALLSSIASNHSPAELFHDELDKLVLISPDSPADSPVMSEKEHRLFGRRLTSEPVDLPSMPSLASALALLEEGSDDDGDDSSDSMSSIASYDCDEALTSPVTSQYPHYESVAHGCSAYVLSRRPVLLGDL
jgi:hypothetical protein